MKGRVQLFITTIVSFIGLQAWAYPEGRFECKNVENLPNNVYEISKINVGGKDLPFVKIQRFYKGPKDANGNPTQTQSQAEGIAIYSQSDVQSGVETLLLAQIRVDFIDGEIYNCKKP